MYIDSINSNGDFSVPSLDPSGQIKTSRYTVIEFMDQIPGISLVIQFFNFFIDVITKEARVNEQLWKGIDIGYSFGGYTDTFIDQDFSLYVDRLDQDFSKQAPLITVTVNDFYKMILAATAPKN